MKMWFSAMTDETGQRLRDKLIEIYDKTVWKDNRGSFVDDGNSDVHLNELENILSVESQLAVAPKN
jgi:hypothetical protein